MYSNARILPLPQTGTSYQLDSEYTGLFTFGKIDSAQMIIYILFALSVIGLYLIWIILV